EAVLVRDVERARHLLDQPHVLEDAFPARSRRAPAGSLAHDLLERTPLDPTHREVGQAVDLAGFVDGADARVVEPRGGFDLAAEALARAIAAEVLGADHLERDVAPERRVARAIDDAHAAAADLPQEAELAELVARRGVRGARGGD